MCTKQLLSLGNKFISVGYFNIGIFCENPCDKIATVYTPAVMGK